jgi:hypothetical protein
MDIEELLTADEVVHMLRLDARGLKNPRESLRNLRRTGRLGFVKVAGEILYPKSEIHRFILENTTPSRYTHAPTPTERRSA